MQLRDKVGYEHSMKRAPSAVFSLQNKLQSKPIQGQAARANI